MAGSRKRTAALVLAGALALSTVGAQTMPNVELPVTKVVLYASGVAYFERSGQVEGNVNVRLTFKVDEINDILKSLVVRDSGGGSVSLVNYSNQDPLGKTLKSFALDLSDKPTLAGILDRMRGKEVTVTLSQVVTGRIMGVESAAKQATIQGQAVVFEENYLNLMTDKGLRSIPMSAISQYQFSDDTLNQEIGRALMALDQASDNQKKTVDIRFSGSGKRTVSVAYISAASVWKTSYRLDLSDLKSAKNSTAFLQAWAIVENSSESDWKDVRLSLVAGSPVSFVQDLYTPLYVTRQVIAPSVAASVEAQNYDTGMVADKMAPQAPAMTAMAAPSPARQELAGMSADDFDGLPGSGASVRTSAATSSVASAKVGELFNFTIQNAIALGRQGSAMIPLINKDISAEKVSIFTASSGQKNPMSGAVLTNSTGLRLPSGPITVFDGGSYAGDALTSTVGDGERKLISYALDLDTLIDQSDSQTSSVTKVSVVRGVLSVQQVYNYTKTYKIKNGSTNAKSILIEHPKRGNWNLMSPKDVWESTPSVYRLKTSVDAGKTVDYVVTEQQTGADTYALLSANTSTLQLWIKSDKSSAALKTALQRIADLKAQVDAINSDINDLNTKRASTESSQARLRNNIETVGRDSPEGQSFLQKLMVSETAIDQIQSQIDEKKGKLATAQSQLESYVRSLSVE